MKWLQPSILDLPSTKWSEWLKTFKKFSVATIHYDVMDGHLVPTISFGHRNLPILTTAGFKVSIHLMVKFHSFSREKFHNFLDYYRKYSSELIFQFEGLKSNQIIWGYEYCQKHQLKWGLALDLPTSLTTIDNWWKKIDRLLLLGVPVGFGGQLLNEQLFKKLIAAKKFQTESKFNFKIIIDGGVKPDNLSQLLVHRPDFLVIGSYLATDVTVKLPLLQKLNPESE